MTWRNRKKKIRVKVNASFPTWKRKYLKPLRRKETSKSHFPRILFLICSLLLYYLSLDIQVRLFSFFSFSFSLSISLTLDTLKFFSLSNISAITFSWILLQFPQANALAISYNSWLLYLTSTSRERRDGISIGRRVCYRRKWRKGENK